VNRAFAVSFSFSFALGPAAVDTFYLPATQNLRFFFFLPDRLHTGPPRPPCNRLGPRPLVGLLSPARHQFSEQQEGFGCFFPENPLSRSIVDVDGFLG